MGTKMIATMDMTRNVYVTRRSGIDVSGSSPD